MKSRIGPESREFRPEQYVRINGRLKSGIVQQRIGLIDSMKFAECEKILISVVALAPLIPAADGIVDFGRTRIEPSRDDLAKRF